MKWIGTASPLLLIALAGVGVTAWMRPGLVRFWPFTIGEVAQLFAPLILVALFIERALEVFLTAWRGKNAASMAEAIKRTQKRMGQGATASEDLHALEQEQTDYKASTQRIAFVSGLGLGVIVSTLGVRGLELFVDPAAFKELTASQRT